MRVLDVLGAPGERGEREMNERGREEGEWERKEGRDEVGGERGREG